MELNIIYADSAFENTIVPSGQRFLFLGYENGTEGGNVVIRYKDSNGLFGNIASGSGLVGEEQSVEINTVIGNKLVVSSTSVPVFIKTNLGNFYPIEKDTISQSGGEFQIDIEPYLAYDNVLEFTGPWTVYLSGGINGQNGRDGQGLNYDAAGIFSDRSKYDDQPYKFSFLATDVGAIYVKLENGSWSDPIYLSGRGGTSNQNTTIFEVYANDTELTEINGVTLKHPVAPCMTHKQVIRTKGTVSEQDIVINWGDGTVDELKNGNYEKYVAPAVDDNDQYSQFTVSHTYSSSGKYVVTITGTTCWGLRTPKTEETDGYAAGHGYNLICNALSKDLMVSDYIYNLSDFLRDAPRLTEIKTEPYVFNNITNIYGMCRDCKNLVTATGFPSLHTMTSGYVFRDCVELVTTDFVLPYYVEGVDDGDAGMCFYNCSKLFATVSSLLPNCGFAGRRINLNKTFYGCSYLTGPVPTKILWEDDSVLFVGNNDLTNTTSIFEGCNNELLSLIPTLWGGTMNWTPANSLIDEASYFVTTNSDNYEIQVGIEHIGGISIVWGDGEFQTISGSASIKAYKHTYESAGTYKVIITGNISRISYANNNTAMGALIDSIESFPNKTITSLKNTFARCSKIKSIPSNVTTDGISDLYGFCRGCEELRNMPYKFYLSNTIEDASYAFSTCKKLRWNISDVFNWYSGTKNVTSMFINCEKLYGLPDDQVLWNSGDIVFSATSNAFSNTPENISKYVPKSWGGKSETGEETPDIAELASTLSTINQELDTI